MQSRDADVRTDARTGAHTAARPYVRTCAHCKRELALSAFNKTVDTARCKACIDYLRGLTEYMELFA